MPPIKLKRNCILGLTGGFGSGKTTVAHMFAKQGWHVIDADAITRNCLTNVKKCSKKIAEFFPDVILSTGGIDRARLSKVVFQNPRELKKLTNILYPEALKEIRRQILLYKNVSGIVLDVPLLFEAGWDQLVDTTVVVKASRQQQIQRIQKRMNLSKSAIAARIKNQMPLKTKCKLADIIIDNRGSLKDTRLAVEAVIHILNKRKC